MTPSEIKAEALILEAEQMAKEDHQVAILEALYEHDLTEAIRIAKVDRQFAILETLVMARDTRNSWR